MLIEVHQGRIQIMPAPKALLKLQKAKSLLSQNMSVFEPEIIHFSGKCLPQVSKAPVCFYRYERVPPSSIPDITSQKFPVWARTEHSSILCNKNPFPSKMSVCGRIVHMCS